MVMVLTPRTKRLAQAVARLGVRSMMSMGVISLANSPACWARTARVVQGVLERSNVNTTEELIASIELQRSFEVNLRLITAARDMDEAGAALMKMPEG